MTEKIKVADLPQAERDELIKQAQDAGINNAMMANWYVDTLKSKIAEAIAKKGAGADQADESEVDESADGQTDEQADAADESTDEQSNDTGADEQSDDQADGDEPDLTQESKDLNKDTEQPPVTKGKQTAKKAKDVKIAICHICRSKVINGKCTGCGFEISKR